MNEARNILLIRHQKAAQKTQAALADIGHKCTVLAFSEIVPIATAFPDGEFDAIIITSPVGAQILQHHAMADRLKKTPVNCVGEVAAKKLKEAGFKTRYSADAQTLAQVLVEGKRGRNFLYPCAQSRSFDFASHLNSHGLRCTNWEVYENRLITPDSEKILKALAQTDLIFFYSKRTARHFFEVLGGISDVSQLTNHKFIAISQNTATAIPRKFKQNTYIVENKDEISMIGCLGKIDR